MFYEDLVAVTGAALALITLLVISITNLVIVDAIVTLLIGLLMIAIIEDNGVKDWSPEKLTELL